MKTQYHTNLTPALATLPVGGVVDTYESYVWEPSLVKINALTAATEAACLVLSVDETVTNPKSEAANMAPGM